MAFEEAFNPGMSRAREQAERERLLPAPAPVSGPPLFELPDLGVDFNITWTLDPDPTFADDNGGSTAVDPPLSET